MSQRTGQAASNKVDTSVDFKILGPMAVVDGATRLSIGGPKPRTVLAMLIAYGGRPVSNDVIAQAVYGDDTSGRTRRRVQTYVSTLRSVVGDMISKDGNGWALRTGRSQVDALRFEDMYESVRGSQDLAPEAAAKILREALSLWRGHPYVDIEAHGLLDAELARLGELRVAVQAARIDADLASGRDADLIGEIEGFVAEHPYLERLRAQHMLALYRAGRQREALGSYHQMRSLLIADLGVDPTPELQSLERRILDQDSTLDVSPRRLIQKKAVLVADRVTRSSWPGYQSPSGRPCSRTRIRRSRVSSKLSPVEQFSMPAPPPMRYSTVSARPFRRPRRSPFDSRARACGWRSTSGMWSCQSMR